MENTKNGTKPADCRRKIAAAETIIIEQNGTNSPWVGCINSVNYRIERGVPVEVPAAVAAVIKSGKKRSEHSRTHFKGIRMQCLLRRSAAERRHLLRQSFLTGGTEGYDP